MTQSVAQIRCPNCQNPVQTTLEQLVDVAEDPSAKTRLLSGRLNYVQCPTCGYQGQLATPLVYHDPDKELLLTYTPSEVGLNKDDQERMIGRLINRIVDRLPQEQRKGYLLQPKAALTFQGLIEQVLEADGVTKEDLEAQQAQLQLFQELLRTPEDDLEGFVKSHDDELDEAFFQLASLALQSTADEQAATAAAQRLDQALRLSSVGEQLEQRQQEIRAAAESLEALGESATREQLLDLLLEAESETRVQALVGLTRPALDYAFFQMLSERIDAADEDNRSALEAKRSHILELTQEIDEAQQARAMRSAQLLQSVLQAEDMELALQEILPYVDELFLGTLQANLVAAREKGDMEAAAKLDALQTRLSDLIRASLPPSLKLAQQVLDTPDIETGKAVIDEHSESIDDQFLTTLIDAAGRLQQAGQADHAERLRQLHRHAMGHAMRRRMKAADSPDSSP